MIIDELVFELFIQLVNYSVNVLLNRPEFWSKAFNECYFMNHTFSFVIQHPLFNLHTS